MAFDIQGAKAAGYNDEEIKQYLAAKQPKKSSGFLSNIVSSVTKPFTETGRTVVAGLGQTPLAIMESRAREAQASKLPSVLKTLAGKSADVYGGARKALEPIGRTEEEMTQMGNKPLETIGKQIRNSAGVLSYGVPFGKGAGIASKALIPGATVGALQTASEEGKGLEDIAKGAITGAGIAGALHGAGKLIGGTKKVLSKTGKGAEKLGETMQAGVSKIEVPASVYGSSKESAIRGTLKKLGVSGTAAEQYTQLEGKMKSIADAIERNLLNKPKSVSLDLVKSDFMQNLKSALRTKDLNNKVAKQEIQGYLQDLYNTAISETGTIPNKISTYDLFNLKKMVNDDFQGVAKKIISGTPLSSREKVISAARQTLDDIIANAHPEVKEMTVMQSHLYDAAESLNKARKTIPTKRVFGTTIPSSVEQKTQDVVGKGIESIGGKIAGVSEAMPEGGDFLTNLLQQTGVRGGVGIEQGQENIQQSTEGIPQDATDYQGTDQFESQTDHEGSIAQTGEEITPEDVRDAYLYLSADKAKAVENAYKAQSIGQEEKTKTVNDEQLVVSFEKIRDALKNNISDYFNPTSTTGQYYTSQTNLITQLFAKTIEAGRMSDKDRDFYLSLTKPQVIDMAIPGRYEARMNGVIDAIKTRLGV